MDTLYRYTWILLSFVTTTAAGLIVAAGIGLYAYQTKLIYPSHFPPGSREQVPTPDEWHMPDYESITLKTADGLNIKAYLIWKRDENKTPSKRTILYLHANAGNMGHRLPIAHMLQKQLNCNIFIISYRGYGQSEGSPNEKGLKMDAQTALDYIQKHAYLSKTKIIVYGQSIGGAVAIHLASNNESKIHALIIENTFLSLRRLIPSVMPFLTWLTFLCHQKWESFKSIQTLKTLPILFLSGAKDELIPPFHMKELMMLVLKQRPSSETIVMEEFKDGKHNDTFLAPGYMDAIDRFLNKILL